MVKQIILSSLISVLVTIGTMVVFRDEWSKFLMPAPVAVTSDTHAGDRGGNPLYSTVPDIVDVVNDAVVSVVATKDVPVYERYLEEYQPFGDWFGSFAVPRIRANGTETQEVGGGTGFLVSADGLIVTNRHVVADDDAKYSVMLQDGSVYEVVVKAKDPVLDIAILELAQRPSSTLSYLTFGDSDQVRLGETVIAIGNALAEFDNSVSVGIISGTGRSIIARDGRGATEQLSDVFQTDAAINPGNSGGPLLNLAGEVIGVNVAASLGAENIGFAIPSDAVAQIVSSVQTYGEIRRPWLGIRYTMITERMAAANNLDVSFGALVIRGDSTEDLAVIPGSPADKAGLRENDIVVAIDDVTLENTDLSNVLRTKAVDATVRLRVWRQGQEQDIEVTLAPSPN